MNRVLLTVALVFCLGRETQAQTQRWSFETGGKVFSSPAVADGTVYIGSGDGNIYAVHAESGTERWRFETGGAVHSSPVVENDMLYVGSQDGKLYALSALDGKEIWSFETKGEQSYGPWDYYLSTPAISGDLVIFGSGDSNIYAINKDDGSVAWSFATGDIVHASPVVSGGVVFVGSFDGYCYSLNADDGALIWKFDTSGATYFPKGEVQKAALVHGGAVYFGSRDYNIYALDAQTGTGRWNMKEQGSWVIAAPIVFRDRIYFGTSDSHNYYGMEAQTGALLWKLPLNMRAYGSAIVVDETLYFGCFNGKLYAVNPDDGEINWTFQTQGSLENYLNVYNDQDEFSDNFMLLRSDYEKMEEAILSLGSILSTPAAKDGTIYFGSSDGRLYAVSLD